MQARAFMRASLTMRRRAAKSNRGAGFAIHHARWRNPRMRENMEPVMEEKSESIRRLVSRLRLDDRGWVVVEPDPWEADLMAIGVSTTAEPRRIVYLSTYRLKEGRYYYECESPTGPDPAEYEVLESGDDVDFDTLLGVMRRHLA